MFFYILKEVCYKKNQEFIELVKEFILCSYLSCLISSFNSMQNENLFLKFN